MQDEKPSVSPLAAGLYVVATPIGNDADLSPRARDVLLRAHVVLAEDTRRSGLLFARLGLDRKAHLAQSTQSGQSAQPTQAGGPKGFMSLHEHNEAGRIPQVLEMLDQGLAVALISDAGTPVLADPGYRLVRACRLAGLTVSPVPGPSAPAAALSACGLPPAPYTFFGFLPRQKGEVKRLLARHAATGATLVFFERKDRLAATLTLAAECLGDREFAICRELTKHYEEFILGRLGCIEPERLELLGEVTVVIGPEPIGGPGLVPGAPDVDTVLAEETARGGKPREVARRVAERVPGLSVKEAYELLQRT